MIRTNNLTVARNACAAIALAAVAALSARAQTIVDVSGFEAAAGYSTAFNTFPLPGYIGQLEGQVPFASYPNGTWQVPVGGTGSSTAKVVAGNSSLSSGSQMVQVVKGNADGRWGIHNSTFPSPGRTQICIDWDEMVPAAAGGANDFGPFFGVESYYDQAGIFRHGFLGVDATTGAVLIGAAGTGNYKSPDGVSTVAFGAWNHFRMVLDFSVNKYVSFLNGVQIGGAEGFIDGAVPFFTDADIAALSEGPAWATLAGTAYFDNYSVHEGQFCAIPEPAACLLAVLGFAGIAWRKTLAR